MVMLSGMFRTGFTALAVASVLGACATPQQMIQAREDRLAAAGFEVHPADNMHRKAMLRSLPPHRFVVRDVHGSYVYLYSDPLVCGCLYVGTQKAYNTYRQEMFQQNLADEQQMTAQMYDNPAWSFGGWGGPWGPGFGPGFGGPGF